MKKNLPKSPKAGCSNRPPGRPKVRVVGPRQLQMIERMYLEGNSTYVIGEKLGVTHDTIQHHIDLHLRPRWEAQFKKTEEQHRAEIQVIKQEAWARYHRSKKEGLADVKWALEQEAKLGGLYAPEKHEVGEPGEFRAAGQTPEEAAAGILEKLIAMARKLQAADAR